LFFDNEQQLKEKRMHRRHVVVVGTHEDYKKAIVGVNAPNVTFYHVQDIAGAENIDVIDLLVVCGSSVNTMEVLGIMKKRPNMTILFADHRKKRDTGVHNVFHGPLNSQCVCRVIREMRQPKPEARRYSYHWVVSKGGKK